MAALQHAPLPREQQAGREAVAAGNERHGRAGLLAILDEADLLILSLSKDRWWTSAGGAERSSGSRRAPARRSDDIALPIGQRPCLRELCRLSGQNRVRLTCTERSGFRRGEVPARPGASGHSCLARSPRMPLLARWSLSRA
jgi:hypothetical protein